MLEKLSLDSPHWDKLSQTCSGEELVGYLQELYADRNLDGTWSDLQQELTADGCPTRVCPAVLPYLVELVPELSLPDRVEVLIEIALAVSGGVVTERLAWITPALRGGLEEAARDAGASAMDAFLSLGDSPGDADAADIGSRETVLLVLACVALAGHPAGDYIWDVALHTDDTVTVTCPDCGDERELTALADPVKAPYPPPSVPAYPPRPVPGGWTLLAEAIHTPGHDRLLGPGWDRYVAVAKAVAGAGLPAGTPTPALWCLVAVMLALRGLAGRGRTLTWMAADHRCAACGSTAPVGDRANYAIRPAPRPARPAPAPAADPAADPAAPPSVVTGDAFPLSADRLVVAESLDAHPLWDAGGDARADHLTTLALPGGRPAVAVGTVTGVVHVMDLVTGAPTCPPLLGAAEPICALAAVPAPRGAPILVTLQGKQLRWWDAADGRMLGEPVTAGLASALAAVRMPSRTGSGRSASGMAGAAFGAGSGPAWLGDLYDGRWVLAVGDRHGIVWLWDPTDRIRYGEVFRRSGHGVELMVGSGRRPGPGEDDHGGEDPLGDPGDELAVIWRGRKAVDVWSPASIDRGMTVAAAGSDRLLELGTGGAVGLAFLPGHGRGPDPVVVANLLIEPQRHTGIMGVTVLTRPDAPPVIATVASKQRTLRLWRHDTGDLAVLPLAVTPRCVTGAGVTLVVGHDRGVSAFTLERGRTA